MPPFRDPFGRLLTRPEDLPRAEQIACVRRATGALLAATMPELQWLGRVFSRRTTQGGDLEVALGLRPARGSHSTAQRILAIEHRDRLLLRLVVALASQSRAARVLSGAEAAPAAVADLVAELHELGAPCSRRAIVEAARRLRR